MQICLKKIIFFKITIYSSNNKIAQKLYNKTLQVDKLLSKNLKKMFTNLKNGCSV